MNVITPELRERILQGKGKFLGEFALPLDPEDREAYKRARGMILDLNNPEEHKSAACGISRTGKYYTLPQLNVTNHRESSVCGEPGVLMLAASQHEEIVTMVAIHGPNENNAEPFVIAPCPLCIMRLDRHAPDAYVIVDSEEESIKAAIPLITEDLVKLPALVLMAIMYPKEHKAREKNGHSETLK